MGIIASWIIVIFGTVWVWVDLLLLGGPRDGWDVAAYVVMGYLVISNSWDIARKRRIKEIEAEIEELKNSYSEGEPYEV